MTKSRLLVIFSCLVLIGLLAKKDGAIIRPSLPTLVTDAVSADSLPAVEEPGLAAPANVADLAAGEQVFGRNCTLCHSAPLVFKSHILSGEVDSLVVSMLRKDKIELPDKQFRQLAAYLKSRLPKN